MNVDCKVGFGGGDVLTLGMMVGVAGQCQMQEENT